MKALEIQKDFGLENLKLVERERPTPGPGQVLLQMRAAAANYRDLLTIQGHYNPRQPLPLIPFSDGVGEVVEVGDGVSRVEVGERVCPIFAQGWISGRPTKEKLATTLGGPRDGTLTQFMLLNEEGVVQVPAHLTDEEAACLPCAGLTAWSALVTYGQIKAGDRVLLQGTGGVSIFALQFALLHGARVIITSSSEEKLARAKGLGAHVGINYRETPKWGKKVRELTGGRGVDHVIEVGGAETLAQSLAAITPGGSISVIGVLSGLTPKLNLIPILMQNIRLQGIFVGHRSGFTAMNQAVDLHQIKPVVHQTFPFTETTAALETMAREEHFGKLCLKIE